MIINLNRQRLAVLAKMLVVTLIYIILGRMVSSFAGTNFANIIYPSSGVGLAAILLGGKKYALSVYFGAVAISALYQSPHALTFILPLASTLESLAGAWLLTYNGQDFKDINSFKDFCRLTGIAGAFSSAIAAFLGATIL
ncbi:MAG: hypothetical protein PHE96_08790, partial [Methylococcales bacterium]|nr:hypothetical protein [Methylococcales bacterium]